MNTKNIIIGLLIILLIAIGAYSLRNQMIINETDFEEIDSSQLSTTVTEMMNNESSQKDLSTNEEKSEETNLDSTDTTIEESQSLNSDSEIGNPFSFEDIEVGKTIGGLEIIEIEEANPAGPLGLDKYNLRITFSGEVELSGKYSYIEDSMFGESFCFKADDQSYKKLPRYTESSNQGIIDFCFNDYDAAAALLGAELGDENIEKTILIDNYTFVSLESAVRDTADLVEVR